MMVRASRDTRAWVEGRATYRYPKSYGVKEGSREEPSEEGCREVFVKKPLQLML